MPILLAAGGYFCYAVVTILDKIILTRLPSGRQAGTGPIVYTFYSTVISLTAVLVLPWVGALGQDVVFSIILSVVFSIGLFFLFTAVQSTDVSRIGPFNGALIAVFLYVFAFFFLGERLTQLQTIGVAVLVAASLILSRDDSGGRGGRGFVFAVGSAFCFAVAQTIVKFLYTRHAFVTVFAWNSFIIGLIGLLLLAHPAVRASFRRATPGKKSPLPLVAVDKFLAFVAVVLVEYAIAMGSVTLVGALSGIQFVFLFLLIVLLTRFAPAIFRETFTRRGLVKEGVSIVLILIGLVCVSV